MDSILEHYGIKERSGRYPYGSGDDPFQRIKRSGFSRNQKKKIIKKAKQEVREKSVSEMTDQEIEKRMARLKLENAYEQEKRKRTGVENKTSEVETEKPSYYGKSISEMSDSELQAYVNRLQLQQRVAELTKQPSAPETGKQWFAKTMKTAGKKAVEGFITDTTKYGSKKLYDFIVEKDKQRMERKPPSWLGKSISKMTDSELKAYVDRLDLQSRASEKSRIPSYAGKSLSQMTDAELKAYVARITLIKKARSRDD